MASRAEDLARRIQEANHALLQVTEASTPEQWTAKVADGAWTQGFSAYHAAASVGNITEMVRTMASGEGLPPLDFDGIDQLNAEFLAQHPNPTKDEALALIRENAPRSVEFSRGLTEAQLDTTAPLVATGTDVSMAQVAEMLLVGHPLLHVEAIAKAR